MVKENNLSIFVSLDFNSFSSVTWWVLVRIDINDFSVPLVPEQKPSIRVGINSEVWRIVQSGMLGVPVEETQVSWFRKEKFLLLKNLSEIFGLKPVSKIDISRDLILALPLVSDENDGGHSSAPHIILSIGQGFQKVRIIDFAPSVREGFRLLSVFILPQHDDLVLFLLELLSGQDFTFTVVADLDELTGQLGVFEVKQVLVRHLLIQVSFVIFKFCKTVVEHISIIVVKIHI